MKVAILGSGGPRPHPERASPGQAVLDDDHVHLVDCGPGTGHNLALLGLSMARVDHVFLSHTHLDHCLELPSVVLAGYLEGRTSPLNVYGPEGTAHVVDVLLRDAFAYVADLIRAVANVELDVRVTEVETGWQAAAGSLQIHAAEVMHNFPCAAFRFSDRKGVSVTFSGDTIPCDAVVDLAASTDLLIHDCAFPDEMADVARASFHTCPRELGEVAAQAGAKAAAMTHMFPACDGQELQMEQSVSREFGGEVSMAADRRVYDLG